MSCIVDLSANICEDEEPCGPGTCVCPGDKPICIESGLDPSQWMCGAQSAPPIEIHCKDKETGTIDPNSIDTALGCVPTDFNAFVVWFLQRAIGISGGIAFLLMIFGGFKILTSAGDPKGVQAAGEMITSAITGLLFIIFSVFLLELIGVKILGIPGL